MTVTYINLFEIPAGKEEDFVGFYRRVNDYMSAKAGYLGNTMHRAREAGSRYGFVNVVRWESEEELHAAHDEGYLSLVRSPEAQEIGMRFTPGCYDVIHQREH